MAGTALFIGWGSPVRGRERQANMVFGEALQFFGGQQQQGRIDGFEPFNLAPHGGDLSGFLLIRGSGEQLNRLQDDAGFQRLITRAQLIVDNFGVVRASTGEALQQQFDLFTAQLDELT
jgi:hypothetical protein